MSKRNNRIDTEVIALAVTGLSQRAITEKYRRAFSLCTIYNSGRPCSNKSSLTL